MFAIAVGVVYLRRSYELFWASVWCGDKTSALGLSF